MGASQAMHKHEKEVKAWVKSWQREANIMLRGLIGRLALERFESQTVLIVRTSHSLYRRVVAVSASVARWLASV
jgi:hypothetical protein